MAKRLSEAKLESAAFDVDYEFTRFRLGWRRLEGSSPGTRARSIQQTDPNALLTGGASLYGNNNSTAVVAAAALLSSKNTANATAVDPDPDYAIVEHVLLHFRVLIEFFFQHSGDDEQVLADDFIGSQFAKTRPQWVNEYQGRCNDLIAHLSYQRIGCRQKNEHHWRHILENCEAMDEEITKFLNILQSSSPSRRAWFRSVAEPAHNTLHGRPQAGVSPNVGYEFLKSQR